MTTHAIHEEAKAYYADVAKTAIHTSSDKSTDACAVEASGRDEVEESAGGAGTAGWLRQPRSGWGSGVGHDVDPIWRWMVLRSLRSSSRPMASSSGAAVR